METQEQNYCLQHKRPILLNLKNLSQQRQCCECFKNMAAETVTQEQQKFEIYKEINQNIIMQCRKYIATLKKLEEENERKENNIKYTKSQISKATLIQYELLKESTINDFCNAFAFNSKNQQLFIGQYDKVWVYEFKNENLFNKIQTNEANGSHSSTITCLQFLNQSQKLLSAGQDKTIIIWNQDQNNNWRSEQILKGHELYINCVIANESENLIISCSLDDTIKFWKKDKEQWDCIQTLKAFDVRNISLSTNDSKLVGCGHSSHGYENNYIIILEQQNNNQWVIIQKIEVEYQVYRVLFINDDQIVFQQICDKFLYSYKYQNETKMFIKTQEIITNTQNECNFYFPSQIIHKLNIFIVKNGNFLNLFRIKQDGEIELKQSINQENPNFQGCLTENGQYLFTWNKATNQIQIRVLKCS